VVVVLVVLVRAEMLNILGRAGERALRMLQCSAEVIACASFLAKFPDMVVVVIRVVVVSVVLLLVIPEMFKVGRAAGERELWMLQCSVGVFACALFLPFLDIEVVVGRAGRLLLLRLSSARAAFLRFSDMMLVVAYSQVYISIDQGIRRREEGDYLSTEYYRV
jgi:hypothetical protein